MPVLLIVSVAAAGTWEAVSCWLLWRQARAARRHRDRVPDGFRDAIGPDAHRRAADYTVARARVATADGLVGLAVTLGLLGGGLDRLARLSERLIPDTAAGGAIGRDVALIALVAAVGFLCHLPVSVFGTFVVEKRFGFNRTGPRLFVLDLVRRIGLSAVLGLPLLAVLFLVMRHGGPFWWLYAWAALLLIGLAAPAIYVRLVAPLFNRFEPLADAALAARLDALLRRCGFRASGLFTMDASRRSSHGNAFFTGFGRSKRIVLFDTLLDKQSHEEVEAVVAHELGHFRHRHVLFGIARGAVTSFVMLAAVGWLARQPWLAPGFGFGHRGDAVSLYAAGVLLGIVTPVLTPLGNWVSRRNEFQADDFARREVGAAPMVSALTGLARDNASTLTPDPLYALFNYSHPPVPLRVARLLRDARAAA
ncbi:M48 family metallopeptidase [Rhizosaccharibacter radicis]|uniref:M48 family metallopeptidase n=1 Tax=Rhizosaccharibacter radicis TaxID=2782605 RepID=A0ABT1VXC9_9PROT|nr:M48 family metallopeptidase [Acetobacteraceae bacterium KSS12]